MNVDDLFREFLAGRRTFGALTEGLAAIAASQDNGFGLVEAALADLVNRGRLPADLAQILRGSIGTPTPLAPPQPAAEADWLDPPTEVRSPAGPARASGPRAGAMPVPNLASSAPSTPLPPNDAAKNEVDAAILSDLASGFKAFRRGGASTQDRRQVAEDRLLDTALESFRGVRMRRDAVKASAGSGRAFDPGAQPGAGQGRTIGVGTILKDRFVLDREIGRGGMGVVYRAVDRRRLEAAHEQPYVAVKLLSGDIRRSPEAFRSLESEARRVQALAHPNIVTIFDFDRDGASIFIVMELLQGRPLDAVLAEAGADGLGFEASRSLIEQISQGLAFAHASGVIHCDLKPANVFVLDTGVAKILDFGLAIASRGGSFEPGALDGYTLTYASPEILEGKPRHPGDDVFALGCLAYAVVTGRHPFARVSALEARAGNLKVSRPPGLPGPAWRCLRSALSFERSARPADGEAFRKGYLDRGIRGWFGS